MLSILTKVIVSLLAVIVLSKSYVDYKKKRESLVMFLFWAVIWLGAATIIIYPLLIEKVASYTKDQTINFGSLTAISLIFMLFIIYRVYTKAARIEYQLSQLVRKIGLSNQSKDEGK